MLHFLHLCFKKTFFFTDVLKRLPGLSLHCLPVKRICCIIYGIAGICIKYESAQIHVLHLAIHVFTLHAVLPWNHQNVFQVSVMRLVKYASYLYCILKTYQTVLHYTYSPVNIPINERVCTDGLFAVTSRESTSYHSHHTHQRYCTTCVNITYLTLA